MSMETATAAKSDLPLYQEIAGQVIRLIDRGTFRPGDRISSVRGLSRQRSVSITTVLEAYRLLEDSGYIEARPQSGYFVRARLLRPPEEPGPTAPPQTPRSVGTRDLMASILRGLASPRFVQLGAAIPTPELLPVAKLNRILGSIARRPKQRMFEAPAGSLELRTQVARRALDAGCSLTPDEIIITNGCQEAIVFGLRATCRPGDTVAVESPAYFGFLQAIDLLGLKVIEIKTYPRDGICLDEVRQVIRRHRVRVFLLSPSFHNPLGSRMPDAKKEALVAILAQREIPLIEDDIVGDLGHGLDRPKAAKAYDRKGLVLLCSSFTKTLAPGYRVGWIAPGRFREAVEHHKTVTNFSNAVLPQLAIAEFLANGGYDRHLRRLRRAFCNQVTLMTQAVGESFPKGTRVTRPSGGFLLWVELPRSVDALELHDRALKAGITIAPGPLFSAKGSYRNFIRLSAGGWSERIHEAVRTLGKLASS